MVNKPIIVWLTRDLRLADNPALYSAAKSGAPVICVYIHDERSAGRWKPGSASRWWLAGSLRSLAADLEGIGSALILRRGNVADVLCDLVEETQAVAVHWTRPYEPHARAAEQEVRAALEARGVLVKRFSGRLLFEPETVVTGSGEPYKVFTPFYKACMAQGEPEKPLPSPSRLPVLEILPRSDLLEEWRWEPVMPDWAVGLRESWAPGEAGARARLLSFLDEAAGSYEERRDRPDLFGTSRLSPYLAFGELSPRQIWHAAQARADRDGAAASSVYSFLRQLVWREFSYYLLFHWPTLPEEPWRDEFQNFPWDESRKLLQAWQRGRTGYPIIDAGMKQLWYTGWMHNRVRMLAASFLVKDLLVPWQDGEAWFWDTLVDADLANNAASWQWVAGSGADAAPYFRVFNPVLQGEKFDPEGVYVRRWLPELGGLPNEYIHAPWKAPASVLEQGGVRLGENYPLPVVDHAVARKRALAAYARLKEAKGA